MVFAFFAAPVLPVAGNEAQEPVCPFAVMLQGAFDQVDVSSGSVASVQAYDIAFSSGLLCDEGAGYPPCPMDYLLSPVNQAIDYIVGVLAEDFDLLKGTQTLITGVYHEFFEDINVVIDICNEGFIYASLTFVSYNVDTIVPFSQCNRPSPYNNRISKSTRIYGSNAQGPPVNYFRTVYGQVPFFTRNDGRRFINCSNATMDFRHIYMILWVQSATEGIHHCIDNGTPNARFVFNFSINNNGIIREFSVVAG